MVRVVRAGAGGMARQIVAGMIGSALLKAGVAAAPGVGRAMRPLAVAAMAQGLMLYRRLEAATEEARLIAADIVAEAQQQAGETPVRPSGDTESGGHRH